MVTDTAGWSLSFGSSDIGVFADAMLLFVAGLALLTYLGVGASATLLPKGLISRGWLVAPYLGYSLLVTVSGLVVAFGGNVAVSLVVVLGLATALNGRALIRGRGLWLPGDPRRWFLLLGLALPGYLITALSMAHSGTLGYVGPSSDPIMFIRATEWLKTHPAPLFSASSPSLVAPNWNASFPPLDGWYREGLRMGFEENAYAEAYWIFSRGPRYLEASLGLLLGWDSALVFRAAQALMLVMAVPATYLFCRETVRAGNGISFLAALFVGINSSLFFWGFLGHPGQMSWTFLLPVTLVVSLAAMERREKRAWLAGALLVSAHLVSYYQASPALPGLIGFGVLYYLITRPGERRRLVAAAAAIGLGALALTFPEHVKMLLTQRGEGMYQAVGWGDPGFPPLSDALGTTLSDVSVGLIAGKGQVDRATVAAWQSATSVVSAVALFFLCLGLVAGRSAGWRLHLALLLGNLLFLEYLHLIDYRYGYVKLQSMSTFLFSVALAAGIVEAWRWSRRDVGPGLRRMVRRQTAVVPALAAVAIVGAATANAALVAGSYWKMDRNIFNTRMWDGAALPRILPRGAATKMSSGLFGEPNMLFLANYFLRDQEVRGPFALEWVWKRLMLLPVGESSTTKGAPAFELFGKGEIASVYGLRPSEQIWSGNLMKLYRLPEPREEVGLEIYGADGAVRPLPVRLPARVRLLPLGASGDKDSGGKLMIVSLLSEGPATVQLSAGSQRHSIPVESGLSVRSIPVRVTDHVILASDGRSPVALLSVALRPGEDDPPLSEHYPRVMAMAGGYTLRGNAISLRLLHFDDQVPSGQSIDLFSPEGNDHVGWYSLPPLDGGRIREIGLDFDGLTLKHTLLIDGGPFEFPSSIHPDLISDQNSEFIGYLSTTYGGTNPNRMPLFRYNLRGGRIADFESFPFLAAWDDTHTRERWR